MTWWVFASTAASSSASAVFEPQSLPERARSPAEQPCCRRPLGCGFAEREPCERTPAAIGPKLRRDSDAPDQGMSAIGTQLVAGAADDAPVVIASDPQPHRGGVQTAEGEIDGAKEVDQIVEFLGSEPSRAHGQRVRRACGRSSRSPRRAAVPMHPASRSPRAASAWIRQHRPPARGHGRPTRA